MKPQMFLLTATLLAAACTPVTPPISDEPDESLSHCSAVKYLDQIGQPLDDMRAPFGTTARLFQVTIPEDDEVILDRLNVAIDNDRIVTRVWCG